MVFKDYYKILGLTTNRVTMPEIKAAYKEQAKKYHPDLNGGNRKYEERFKDINESYKVLSDPIQKRKYDRIWYTNVGRKNKTSRKAPKTFKEAFVNIFFGNIEENKKTKVVKNAKGDNISTALDITVEEAFLGVTKTLGFKTVSGKMKCYKIQIPAGIKNKENVRLVGQGKKSKTGGKNGDLLIKINIANSEKYKLVGNDIHSSLLLTPSEAALGKKIKFNTIDGEVNVVVPKGTQSGEMIVIENKGYKPVNGTRGNLILETKIVIPKELSEEQALYLQNMEKVINYNPREKETK